LNAEYIEIENRNGIQQFRIVWKRTRFGREVPKVVCDCGRQIVRLLAHYDIYACRFCHRALHESQRHNQTGRKRLAASKLRLMMGGLPDICEAMPIKRQWQHKRTYRANRQKLERLEAPIRGHRFKKPLDTRLFRYCVG
jgi:hypothetical protein